MPDARQGAGWVSGLPAFRDAEPRSVCTHLHEFVGEVQEEQLRAWATWVPALQREATLLLQRHAPSHVYGTILEYRLPRDLRRPDLIVLENGVIVVVELKGGDRETQAGLDQVLAYARDLRAYHALCHERPVVPVLVPARAATAAHVVQGVHVVGPDGLHALLADLSKLGQPPSIDVATFVDEDHYQPLPTIVEAARQLFEHGDLPFIKRARAATEPALEAIKSIAHEAAATRTRHIVFLTGVPGSGKTLVGLQLAHARWLDDLVVARADGKRKIPAVYLSGNTPLVEVMQHALRKAGGGGRTFVQHVKPYIEQYGRKKAKVPPEQVVVFDEAQRAYDAETTADVGDRAVTGETEADHVLDVMGRVPEWAVLVALIGEGQVLHKGEEGGLPMWREALAKLGSTWIAHVAPHVQHDVQNAAYETRVSAALNLDKELRHHLVPKVHTWISQVLDQGDATLASSTAADVRAASYTLLLTRDLEAAKAYLRERYEDAPLVRYGVVASSRDRQLPVHGVDNTWQTTKRLRTGPWMNDSPAEPTSCCRLDKVATEFAVQGLELDMALVAWGADLLWENGAWSNRLASKYRVPVRDALALRRNAYRVLLSRGRDGSIIFVPDDRQFDETASFLLNCGVQLLNS